MLEASDSAWAGMERGALRFQDTVGTAADRMERLFSGALSNISDLLANLLGRSQFDLNSFFSSLRMSAAQEISGSIVSSLIPKRTEGQSSSSGIFGFLGSLFSFGGKRHRGGEVQPGVTYIVGKDGAEEFYTPDQPGYITTHQQVIRELAESFKSESKEYTSKTLTSFPHIREIASAYKTISPEYESKTAAAFPVIHAIADTYKSDSNKYGRRIPDEGKLVLLPFGKDRLDVSSLNLNPKFAVPDYKSINQAVSNFQNSVANNNGAKVGRIEVHQTFYGDAQDPRSQPPGFHASQYQILKNLSDDLKHAGRHS